MDRSGNRPGRLIYGGSFNPIHIGHLRLAIEACRLLGSRIGRVDFVPVACPPHKKSGSLLPFGLRCELVRISIAGIPGMECNSIEESLPRPSYSEQTIEAIARDNPGEELFFLLGSSDFTLLPEWKNGTVLPRLCNLVVAPRGELDFAGFIDLTKKIWPSRSIVPQSRPEDKHLCGPGHISVVKVEDIGLIYYLPVPFLEISATYIRSLWLCGGNIDFLLPCSAIDLLDRERTAVEACWRRTD